jgi:hypothetical protein
LLVVAQPNALQPHGRKAYGRARELAEHHGNIRQLFQATYGLWQNKGATGSVRDARVPSVELLELAGRGEDDVFRLQAHHSGWTTGLFSGMLLETHTHLTEGRRLYDPERHHSHRFIYGGHDPGVCAVYTDAQINWLLGFPDRAMNAAEEALEFAEQIAHLLTREIALEYAAHVYLHCGAPEISLRYMATVERLRTEQRVSFIIEPAILRAAAQLQQGAIDDAAGLLREVFCRAERERRHGSPMGMRSLRKP